MNLDPNNPLADWLNKEYLETVFRKYKRDDALRIVNADFSPATAKGDNYVSVLTRIKIKYQLSNSKTECGSYVVKSTLEDDSFTAQIIKGYQLCSTEMLMYDKILTKLTELLREIGDCDKIFAEAIHVDYGHSAIILEDLAVQNFRIADRIAGMSETEARLTLKSLAKMHAAGAVLNERMPGVLEKLNMGFFNRSTRGLAPYYEGLFEICANFAGDCEALGASYKNKLLSLKPYVVEYCTRVFEPPQNYFKTLLHGDVWTNNILLRYSNKESKQGVDTAELQDIVLLDFQFSSWSTPAVDLHYFFNTSLPNELRIDRQNELVKYYYDILADTLRQLKYGGRIPSLHDICVQMEAGRFYAVSSSVVNQSVMINNKTDDAEFKNLVGSDECAYNFRRILYTNKRVQENMKVLLPYFDRKGLLDNAMKRVNIPEPASAWLTKEYFESILRKYKKDNGLKVIRIKTSGGTAKGDSFISTLTRIKVEYQLSNSKELQNGFYIAKTNYEGDPFIAELMESFDVYNREMLIYQQILPQMSELLLQIGDNDKLFADTIHVDFERSAIILEDLSVSSFVIGDRIALMDKPQAKLVLRKLAKFHAAGARLNERMPNILTSFEGGYLRRTNRTFEPFQQGMVEECANFANNCQELGPYYKEKLLKLKSHIIEYSVRCFDPKEGHFLTLVHSDLWSTNIMMSFEPNDRCNGTKIVKDARLIDFQFSNWSSPAVDLHYFINTSLKHELRLYHQNELIQYYHEVLANTLKQLNYGGHVPTLHELCVQLEERRFYAFTSTIVNQPLQTSEYNEDSDLKCLTETNERSRNLYKVLYRSQKTQDRVKVLLPFFDRRGLLDIVD